MPNKQNTSSKPAIKGSVAFMVVLLLSILCPFVAFSQWRLLINDPMDPNLPQHRDISNLHIWGTNSQPVSALKHTTQADTAGLSLPCLTITDSAVKYSGYTAANSLKTATAFDYVLPVPLNREADSLKVEFDVLWDTMAGIGEGGRIVMAAMHNYPVSGGPYLGTIDSVQLDHPFGRPAYNFRLLNKLNGHRPAGYMFYGGGADINGEFEKTAGWWLPGFIAQPPGVAPGQGADYPVTPNVNMYTIAASSKQWRRITFKLFPEKLELYFRPSTSADTENQLLGQMLLPKENLTGISALDRLRQLYNNPNLTSLPTLYKWFPTVNALRFYFRANTKAFLTNIKVFSSSAQTSSAIAVTQPPVFGWPNPTNQYFTLSGNLPLGTPLQLTDMQGKTYTLACVEGIQNQYNLSAFPKGIYFWQAITANGVAKGRLVKL